MSEERAMLHLNFDVIRNFVFELSELALFSMVFLQMLVIEWKKLRRLLGKPGVTVKPRRELTIDCAPRENPRSGTP